MLPIRVFAFGISILVGLSPLGFAEDASSEPQATIQNDETLPEQEDTLDASHDAPSEPVKEKFNKKNLDIQLNEPVYKNGALSTTKGGTITGKDLFLQARNINYIRRQEDGKSVHKILADGDLFFLFKGKAYTGDKIEIDVEKRKSIIYNGCSSIDPWFVGGKIIELEPDGSGIIHDGYMTTSENERNEWSVESSEVHLSKGSKVKAKNVRFLFVRMPILWLPTFSTDLSQERRAPFKYRFRWDSLGPRIGISYNVFEYKRFKAEFLFDVLLKKGLGAGVATNYESEDHKTKFKTYNYVAEHFQNLFGRKKLRTPSYRFQGRYDDLFIKDTIDFKVTYDKLSNLDIRGEYPSVGFDSGRIMPTQATFSRKTEDWISSLNTKVRINDFQTVKQELPLFQFSPRPIKLGETDYVLNNRFSAGYLDYLYAEETHHVRNFHSSRIELGQDLYRNFLFSGLSLTPQIGYTVINYNKSPEGNDKLLALGKAGVECHTRFVHSLKNGSAAVEPYVNYEYLTTPSVSPRKHYIFDLQDGWHRVNMLRFGLKNFLSQQTENMFLERFSVDLYARAFINTPTIDRSIPRVYADATWKATPYTAYSVRSAWDTKRNEFDHVNVKSDFTISEDVALSLEYRNRNSYAWRKLDPDNFILDSFRTERELRHSQVSDRRDTALAKVFMRLAPDFAVELNTRYGWGRHHQPSYRAYEIDILTLIRGALVLKLSLQYRTGDRHAMVKGWRSSWDFSLGLEKPHMSSAFKRIGQGNYDN